MADGSSGPLAGLRVVEFAGIGPGPYAAMLLADLGADVLRIDRPGGTLAPNPIHNRGRATLVLDLGQEDDRARARAAVARADALIEGFRPGVMERLGLGPTEALELNPRLVYGRMTGWGQEGPLAHTAGHDITYIAITGALKAIGDADRPATVPLNLVGDFGGGSMFLVTGILAALLERERSGLGQVVDAAIVDGVNSFMTMFAGLADRLHTDRGANLLGGAAPFYRVYRCLDGEEIAVGALEPRFYAELVARTSAPAALCERQYDRANWPERAEALGSLFGTRPASAWVALLEGTDACVAPVLSLSDVPEHLHQKARGAFVEHDGLLQAAPAPRFSRTPGAIRPTMDGAAMLAEWEGRKD